MQDIINEWSAFQQRYALNHEVAAFLLLLATSVTCFAFVFLYSMFRRLMAGASPKALLQNGCFEWIPGRGLLHVLYGVLWITQVGGLFAVIASGLRIIVQFDKDRTPDWLSAILAAAISIIFFFCRSLDPTCI